MGLTFKWDDKKAAANLRKAQSSIEVGKLADLVLAAEPLERVAPDALSDVEIVMTVVGGDVAFEKAG